SQAPIGNPVALLPAKPAVLLADRQARERDLDRDPRAPGPRDRDHPGKPAVEDTDPASRSGCNWE
ncbi:MAG: hypothetical protein M3Q16_00530, partial [Pseudomonadota bacterium]|nr:hypothetical protein [Pseudomonadota bacterium]